MRNVTITLDEQTVQWARSLAASRSISLSRLIGEMLAEKLTAAREYDEAMRRFLAVKPVPLGHPGERRPTRDELHDRAALR
jgi:hypothetical protein